MKTKTAIIISGSIVVAAVLALIILKKKTKKAQILGELRDIAPNTKFVKKMVKGKGSYANNVYFKNDKGDTYVKIPSGKIIKTSKDISVYTT